MKPIYLPMKILGRTFVSVLSVALHLSPCVAEPLRVGVVVSLTGPAAEQGKSWLSGVELAASEARSEGTEVLLFIEDDKTNPSSAATAFTKLATINSPNAVIGGTWDFLAEVIYPLAERHQVPFLTPTNPPEVVTAGAPNNRWVFTNGLSLTAEREAIEGFLLRHKPEKVQIIACQVPFCVQHAEMVEQLSHFTSVSREDYPMEDISGNLRILALRTFQRPFDLLYFVGDYTTVDLMLRELQRIKRAPLFLTTAHLEDAFRLSKDHERFKNAYGVYPRTNPEFARRFEKANGHKPKVLAAAGYDALRFLITAFRSKVDITAPEAKLTYGGVTGEHSLPPRGRGIAETQAVIAHIVGGELVEETVAASEKP